MYVDENFSLFGTLFLLQICFYGEKLSSTSSIVRYNSMLQHHSVLQGRTTRLVSTLRLFSEIIEEYAPF